MSDYSDPAARRKFLKLLGGSVVLIPLASLTGCSGEKEAAPAAQPKAAGESAAKKAESAMEDAAATMKDKAEDAAATVKQEATETMDAMADKAEAAAGDVPRLSEDDPQAKALGYRHDASLVDGAKYPRYQAGQACANCALFQGQGGAEWARCSIFPGRQVNAKGWCSAYAPKG